jgi:hypothetical protein
VPISKPDDESSTATIEVDIPDERDNPEDHLLSHEFARRARQLADSFLDQLAETVRRKPKQSERMLHVLWHCYLEPGRMSNVQLAKQLGVSDSLISDYCNRVNRQLQTLELTVEQARVFESALKLQTSQLINSGLQQRVA